MITLEDTLDEQKDLARLCANRGNPSVDIFSPNGHYGTGDVYKTYADLPLTIPLNGVVPHGVELDPDWIWYEEIISPVPYIYCYPEFRQSIYRRHTDKKVILSTSPFIYVVDMLKGQPKPIREGTLFFPSHSTEHIIVQQDYNNLAKRLLALNKKYQPVHVCIYWKDYLLGAAKPFQDRGIPIVSAGHIYDRLFLYRLYHLLSQYQYMADNELGTQLFYGIKAGCAHLHIDFKCTRLAPKAVLKRDFSFKKSYEHQRNIARVFNQQTPTSEQKELADYYLGAAYFKTREELRNDLLAT